MPAVQTTRADTIRRYVELVALGDVISNLYETIADKDPIVSFDALHVGDDQGDVFEASKQLLDHETEYEGTIEYALVTAESAALATRLFTRLATDEGREELLRLAAHFAGIAGKETSRARALSTSEEAS